jgi:hypothetical protein
LNLDDLLRDYLVSLDPWYTGVGDGKLAGLIGTGSTIKETITCRATDATHFAVAGSVSGDLGIATVGSAFTSSVAHFTITAGETPWAAGDKIGFEMTPPGTLRSAGPDYAVMPSNDGSSNDDGTVHGALFRKAFAASRRAIQHRIRREWN